MTEPIQPLPPMKQIDLMDTYQKVQNILLQRQEQETRRRALEGGAAGGRMITHSITPGGGYDPAVQAQDAKSLPPELVPDAVKAASEATSAAVKTQSESAAANRTSVDYMANSLGVLLASHPKGIPTPDGVAVLGSLNALGTTLPIPYTVMSLEMAKQPNDKARSLYIAQKLQQSLGSAIWTTTVDTVDPATGAPMKKLVADVIAEATGQTPPGGPAETAEPGSVPAGGPAKKSGLSGVVTGPGSAQENLLKQAGTYDTEAVKRDYARSDAATKSIGILQNMLVVGRKFTGGPLATQVAPLMATYNQITGSKIQAEAVAAEEDYGKLAASIAAEQAAAGLGAGATDMGRAQLVAANLNPNISNLGKEGLTKQLIGNAVADAIPGLIERDLGTDAAKINDFRRKWADHNDPRVFQYAVMKTDDERALVIGAARMKGADPEQDPNRPWHWVGEKTYDPQTGEETGRKKLDATDYTRLDDFWRNLQFAKTEGWLDHIPASIRNQ